LQLTEYKNILKKAKKLLTNRDKGYILSEV